MLQEVKQRSLWRPNEVTAEGITLRHPLSYELACREWEGACTAHATEARWFEARHFYTSMDVLICCASLPAPNALNDLGNKCVIYRAIIA